MWNQRIRSNSILVTVLAVLVALVPILPTPAAHATATSVEYLATGYTGTGSWAPSVGTGDATVFDSPPYDGAYGIKVNGLRAGGTFPITVPHNSITDLSTSEPRTVQAWVYLNRLPASGQVSLFAKFNSNNWDGYYISVDSTGKISLTTNAVTQPTTSSLANVISSGRWYLISIVAQIGGVRKLYVDNTLVIDGPSHPSEAYANNSDFGIGGFVGCVGGFRAVAGELDATQIATVRTTFANSTLTGTCPATVTVSYNGNSNTAGTAPSSGSATTGTVYNVASAGTLASTGYTFSGWNTLANGTGTDYAAGTSITWDTGSDTTLFAKWTANTLAVTYDANGGSAPSGGSTSTTTGATMSSLASTSRAGHSFNGWFTASSGGTQVTTSAGHGQTSNFTLFAQWTAATFTVTYAYNDATGGNSTASASFSAGDSALTLPTPTRTGYTFDGWYSDNGFTSLMGAAGASYSPASNLTAYAKWTANTFTVTYDEQGGSAVSDGSTATGGSIAASPGSPTRTGFTFDGWFTAPSGGTAISFPYSHGQTAGFTLYARWSPAAATTIAPSMPPTPTTTTTTPTTTTSAPSPTTTRAPARRRPPAAPQSTSTTTSPQRPALAPLLPTPSTTTTTVPPTTTTAPPAPSTTTPVVNVVAPITNLSQPVLADNQLPKAEPDNPIVIQTGPDTTWDVITINNRVVQMRDTANFRLTVTAMTATGEMSQVNTRGAITLTHGHYITVTGDGYKPGTEVVAWLFSKPRRLGTIRVATNGSFESKLLVDSSVEFGEHTAQVNGFTASGELRSLNLAVEVVEPTQLNSAANTGSVITQWRTLSLMLIPAFVLAVGFPFVLARRRRSLASGRKHDDS